MTWIEQVIEQRKKHPTAAILGPTLPLHVSVAEALANLVGEDQTIDKGLIFWTHLPGLGRVRIHLVGQDESASVEPV